MNCFSSKIRNHHCKVVLLDQQELIQEIQSSSVGQELLENIFKHLNLIETSYFGLRYIDNTGQTQWLDPGRKIIKQLEGTEPMTLYLGVKFYAADPCKLVEEITRYQFFLQIKQDILQGRLPVPHELTAELCAYAVQSELGDFDSRRHCSGYISEFRFIENQSEEIEEKIGELHKTMSGQVPAVAELNFLEKVKWLEMYGVDLHPVLGEDNVDYFLGLTPSGIIVLRNKTKVGNYFWPRINKLNHKGKYFMLRVRNKNNEEQTYGFETPSKSACKHLWRCAAEHHAFFRLVQVAPLSIVNMNANKTHSLSSRFRDSGRSDNSVRRRAQPEFVRTPSRRYQKRVVEGAQEDADLQKGQDPQPEETNAGGVSKTLAVPRPVETVGISRAPSMYSVPIRSDSPRSVRSAPWPAPKSVDSKYPTVPSPKSVRSAGVGCSQRERERNRRHRTHSRKRSVSAESNSSCDSRSHRRHRHRSKRKGSDAESEASRASGRSHKKRNHKSSSATRHPKDSGSDSENCGSRHRHRHKRNEKYELVDSEMQWKEVQKKQAQIAVQQASVVRDLGIAPSVQQSTSNVSRNSVTPLRRPSTTDPESHGPNQRRRQRRSYRRNSPDKSLPDEVKKHLDFDLIDTAGMTEEERRQIPYTKIETNQEKLAKSNKLKSNSVVNLNHQPLNEPSACRKDLPSNSNSGTQPELPDCGDSPPPPYTPLKLLSSSKDVRPPVPTKPSINNLKHPFNNPAVNERCNFGPDSNRHISNKNKVPIMSPTTVSFNHTKSGICMKPLQSQVHLGLPDSNGIYPSPSESPDSQKVDSHHENSDSGLGTDHQEYYKTERLANYPDLRTEVEDVNSHQPLPQQSMHNNYHQPSSVWMKTQNPWDMQSMAQSMKLTIGSQYSNDGQSEQVSVLSQSNRYYEISRKSHELSTEL